MTDLSAERVCVTGGAGFLGRAVCRVLQQRGVTNERIFVPRRRDYDLTREADVERLFADARPTVLLHLAAEVGGIGANMAAPGRFFYANLAMGLHLIERARREFAGASAANEAKETLTPTLSLEKGEGAGSASVAAGSFKRIVLVGTVCAYPKFAPVPFREGDLWNGYPEETNAPYGVAKKSLFVMLDAYRRQYGLPSAVVVPTNLYGPGDNFDPGTSHVIPALIRKMLEAKQTNAPSVQVWGTGAASREFLYVDDAAEAIVRTAERIDDPSPINLAGGPVDEKEAGGEIAIRDLAERIARLCDYRGRIEFDPSKPDGQPRRSVDGSRAARLLDWRPTTDLDAGLGATIRWYEV